jgi:hypothetical protein
LSFVRPLARSASARPSADRRVRLQGDPSKRLSNRFTLCVRERERERERERGSEPPPPQPPFCLFVCVWLTVVARSSRITTITSLIRSIITTSTSTATCHQSSLCSSPLRLFSHLVLVLTHRQLTPLSLSLSLLFNILLFIHLNSRFVPFVHLLQSSVPLSLSLSLVLPLLPLVFVHYPVVLLLLLTPNHVRFAVSSLSNCFLFLSVTALTRIKPPLSQNRAPALSSTFFPN